MNTFYKVSFSSLFIIILVCTSAKAQEWPLINTDRPDLTESSTLVPVSAFQMETGFNYGKRDLAGMELTHTNLFTTLFRYGLNSNIELRYAFDYTNNDFQPTLQSEKKFTRKGFTPAFFGAKLAMAKETGYWPETALLAHVYMPFTASADFLPNLVAPELVLAFGHSIGDAAFFSYNIGATWDGFSPEAAWHYSLSYGTTIIGNLNGYFEFYSYFYEKNKPVQNIDFGLGYWIARNVQVDFSVGTKVFSTQKDWFTSLGFSFRLPK